MSAPTPAEPADHPNADNTRRPRTDRHGRRQPRTASKRSGPRYTVGPPKTVPMTGEEYKRAVHAWAVLIAAWWTEHPPDADGDNQRDGEST